MSELLAQVSVRFAVETDLNFVRSAWLRSHRAHCEWAPKGEYFALHHDVVEGLLVRGTTLLAVNAADEDQILGFVCGESRHETPILHYVYVKRAFRGNGVAMVLVSALLGGTPQEIIATHSPAPRGWTPTVARLPRFKVRPTLAFYLGLKPSGVK